MVLAHDLKKWLDKKIEEGRERHRSKLREEGQAKANELWNAWLARKEEAEARGQPFTEPPPNGKTP